MTAPASRAPYPFIGILMALAEVAFVVVALLLFGGGLLDWIFTGAPEGLRDQVVKVVWPLVYLGAAIGVWPALRGRISDLWAIWPGAVMVGVAFVSTLWSIEPAKTLQNSIALGGTTLFGFYLAQKYQFISIVRIMAGITAFAAVVSLILAVAFPLRGVMQDQGLEGNWCGMWVHKNSLGGNMFMGALFCVIGVLRDPKHRLIYGGIIALAGFLLIMSDSKTAMLLLVACSFMAYLVVSLESSSTHGLLISYLGAVGAGGLYALMKINPSLFFKSIGEDETLTGRADIWQAIFALFERDDRWLGFGYGAFWESERSPAWFLQKVVQWPVSSAHHGWLDVWLQTGYVGAVIVGLIYLTTTVRALPLIGKRPEMIFAVPFLVGLLLYSFSESILMNYNNVTWVMANMAFVYIWHAQRRS